MAIRRPRSQSLPPPSQLSPRPYGNGVALYDAPVYLYTSTFRSKNLELSIRSPRIKYVKDPNFLGQSIPVFSGKDSIGGTVITAIPNIISSEHRLQISMEGAFFWTCPTKEERQASYPSPVQSALPDRLKHVFLSSTITVRLIPETPHSKFRTNIHESLKRTFFRRQKKRPPRQRRASDAGRPQNTNSAHAFAFPLPIINDEEVPSTMAVSHICQSGYRGRWYAEGAQIAYKLSVKIVPKEGGKEGAVPTLFPENVFEEQLEAPFIIEREEPEVPFEPASSDSWSHFQLESPQPLDYTCTLSLPKPAAFMRTDKAPFYVFVTTYPKSSSLAQQIIRQAVIRVTLIRKIHLDSRFTFRAPAPRKRLQEVEQPLQIEGVNNEQSEEEREEGEKGRDEGVVGGLLRRVSTRTPKIFKWNRSKQKEKEEMEAAERENERDAGPSHRTRPVDRRHRQDHRQDDRHHHHTSSTATTMNSTTSSGRSKLDKPLPAVPPPSEQIFEDTLFSVTAEGFPRRVARKSKRSNLQPQTIAHSDGVLKGEVVLTNELLNSLEWPGVAISYFVEASVYFEDEIASVRVPVQVTEPYK